MTKLKVIYIFTFPPPYEMLEDQNVPKPLYSWKNVDNTQMSIWRGDWPISIGMRLMEKYSKYLSFEVWRADKRADQIYQYESDTGFKHVTFPYDQKKEWFGLKRIKYHYSFEMERYLKKYISQKHDFYRVLFVLPAQRTAFTLNFQEIIGDTFPILHNHFTNNSLLIRRTNFTINVFALFHRFFIQQQTKNTLQKIQNLIVTHYSHLDKIKNRNNKKIYFNTHPEKISFWTPDKTKIEARKILNLPSDTILIFSSSRVVPEYRIDKIIDVLGTIENKNYLYIISGQGNKDYIKFLKEKTRKYKLDKNIIFTGYLKGNELKNYYLASNAFLSTCVMQSAPMSSIKAMLLEVPVVTTDTGFAVELLKKYDSGYIISARFSLKNWKKTIEYVLNEHTIKTPKRELFSKIFDENKIDEKWYEIFREIVE